MTTYFEEIDYHKAMNKVIEDIAELIKQVVVFIQTLWESLKEFLKQTNPHLFHLAYKHKKSRVRKKNLKRFGRVLSRGVGIDFT